jgi:hypothetical protein
LGSIRFCGAARERGPSGRRRSSPISGSAMRDKTTGDIVAPHSLMLSFSGSHRNLAGNPRRRLGAEADFDQLLLKVLNGIRLKCD